MSCHHPCCLTDSLDDRWLEGVFRHNLFKMNVRNTVTPIVSDLLRNTLPDQVTAQLHREVDSLLSDSRKFRALEEKHFAGLDQKLDHRITAALKEPYAKRWGVGFQHTFDKEQRRMRSDFDDSQRAFTTLPAEHAALQHEVQSLQRRVNWITFGVAVGTLTLGILGIHACPAANRR